jgi:hypothetical protein
LSFNFVCAQTELQAKRDAEQAKRDAQRARNERGLREEQVVANHRSFARDRQASRDALIGIRV